MKIERLTFPTWSARWAAMAERARVCCTTLSPRTDKADILRWYCRWLRSMHRANIALVGEMTMPRDCAAEAIRAMGLWETGQLPLTEYFEDYPALRPRVLN